MRYLMPLCRQLWRQWRNLDRLQTAHRLQLAAQGAVMIAQSREVAACERAAELFRLLEERTAEVTATCEQLQACRLTLGVVMMERDGLEGALQLAETELKKVNAEQRERRESDRYWLTRTIARQEVSIN